jgi:hypothetical protein
MENSAMSRLKKMRSLKQPNSCHFRGLKTPKRLFDFQAPENSKKVPFQGPEKAKILSFQGPENSKKALEDFRPRKIPKRPCFRGLKKPIWSREPLCQRKTTSKY